MIQKSKSSCIQKRACVAFICVMPLFFLSVRSWANALGFLAFFVACWNCFRSPKLYFSGRGKDFWLIFLSLISPFLIEGCVQMARGEFIGGLLDGASRYLMAAITFAYLSAGKLEVPEGFYKKSLFAGLLITTVTVILSPGHWWGQRAATYFVDPLTLPIYMLAMICILTPMLNMKFARESYRDEANPDSRLMVAVLFVSTGYVILQSGSRTSWICALLVLTLSVVPQRKTADFRLSKWATLVFALIAISIFAQRNHFVIHRANEIQVEFARLISGDFSNSSIGGRIELIMLDLKLFLINPFLGFGERGFPTYLALKEVYPELTLEYYNLKKVAGSHTELTNALYTRGVFGFVTYGMTVLLPLWYFWKMRRSRARTNHMLFSTYGPFLFCFVLFLAGFSIQTFNLKMTATFYSMNLAMFYAYYYSEGRRSLEEVV